MVPISNSGLDVKIIELDSFLSLDSLKLHTYINLYLYIKTYDADLLATRLAVHTSAAIG
jgi:hypothetical protein